MEEGKTSAIKLMFDIRVDLMLAQAADDATLAYFSNLDQEPRMRISRCGVPLHSLLLEDFVYRNLPELPKKQKTEREENQDYVKRSMAQSTGYVFEQAALNVLRKQPEVEVQTQVKLAVGELSGSCDMLVFNESKKTITVVECKALKYSTKKDAITKAIENDTSTSYLSQLSVYIEGAKLKYPGYEVSGCWLVWCKGSAQLFKVPYTYDSPGYTKAALDKTEAYNSFKIYFEAKDFTACLSSLTPLVLPPKEAAYDYYTASCPIHYSPWSNLLLDCSGIPWDDYEDNLNLMLEYSLNPLDTLRERLLGLVQDH